jgi:hypothetical protein
MDSLESHRASATHELDDHVNHPVAMFRLASVEVPVDEVRSASGIKTPRLHISASFFSWSTHG